MGEHDPPALDLSDKAEAAGTLLLFVAGTAVSIALLSFVFGLDIARGSVGHKLELQRIAMTLTRIHAT